MMHTLLLLCAISANSYTETFNNANAAYLAGNYAQAIQLYEQLVSESVYNPTVFYNLGNAYYRNKQIAPAIANYERALYQNPRFDNAQENLDKAIRETQQRLARPLPPEWEQSLLFWHYSIGKKATFLFATLFWWTFWSILAIRQWRPLRYTRAMALIIGILAIAFSVSAWNKAHPTLLAVTNANPTPVRFGIGENETVRFNLYPGDRVVIDKHLNEWTRVTTADGEKGWTEEKNLVLVGPPYTRYTPSTTEAPKK